MFWTALLLTGLAATFAKMGAASVTISVLAAALQASVFVIAALIGLVIWQKIIKPKESPQEKP